MQITLIIALSLHVLASVFWAGRSFTLARTGGNGGEQLLRPQMGAAVIAVLTGGYLWRVGHAGAFGTAEHVLAGGIVCAIIAAGVQGTVGRRAPRMLSKGQSEEAARSRMAAAQRVAAGLLAVTVICMAAARYV